MPSICVSERWARALAHEHRTHTRTVKSTVSSVYINVCEHIGTTEESLFLPLKYFRVAHIPGSRDASRDPSHPTTLTSTYFFDISGDDDSMEDDSGIRIHSTPHTPLLRTSPSALTLSRAAHASLYGFEPRGTSLAPQNQTYTRTYVVELVVSNTKSNRNSD